MKRHPLRAVFLLLGNVCMCYMTAQTQDKVTLSQNGRETTMSNGLLNVVIDQYGRVKTLSHEGSENLMGDANRSIYFDFTRKVDGKSATKGIAASEVEIIKQTDDYAEVLYANTTYHPQYKQGFILRRGFSGLYAYILGYGDDQSADKLVQEMRICVRPNESFLNGYVDDRMQGRIPSSAEIARCEADASRKVQDATWYLDDGKTIYTKYDWAQLVQRDSLHGLMSDDTGIWNIPCSMEWSPGGPTKQELMVHATKTTPITIQMLHGEHFGTSAMTMLPGESKLWGPVLIYVNKGTHEEMIADAKRVAHEQQQAWPFEWFENDLYPLDRVNVTGRIRVTTGQRCDSIQVVLAEPDSHLFDQNKGYMFWALTDSEGRFTIPKVRKGSYALRAYATAGEVTDELQMKDITVDAEHTDLGTIDWTPTRYETLLWQIGRHDRLCEEFRLGEGLRAYGLWNQVPANMTYYPEAPEASEAPASSPDWYYAQTQQGTWTISFDCDKTYTGDAHLTASIAGASRTPTIKVAINGTNKDTWNFPTNDAGIYRSSNVAGRYDTRTCTFPSSLLKVGENKLTLTYDGKDGSGVMWDYLKLEVGEAITTSIAEAPLPSGEGLGVGPMLRIYNLQGRLMGVFPRQPLSKLSLPKGIYIWTCGSQSGKFTSIRQ